MARTTDLQHIEGRRVFLHYEPALRPASRWLEWTASLPERTHTVFSPAFRSGYTTELYGEMLGGWALLTLGVWRQPSGWAATASGLTIPAQTELAWVPFWWALHPFHGYPFDLTHPEHVSRAIEVLRRYAAWGADERADKDRLLGRDATNVERMKQAEARDRLRDQIAPVAARALVEAHDAHGSITDGDAARSVAERRDTFDAAREARARFWGNPSAETRQVVMDAESPGVV